MGHPLVLLSFIRSSKNNVSNLYYMLLILNNKLRAKPKTGCCSFVVMTHVVSPLQTSSSESTPQNAALN